MNTFDSGAAEHPPREEHRFGQHTATIQDDTALLVFVGDESLEEAREIGGLLDRSMSAHPRFYVIVDVRRIGNVPSDTRKAWIVWFKTHNPEAVIVVGAGIAIRSFVKLVAAATRVLTGKEPRFVLVGSEDEARAWLNAYKQRAPARAEGWL
jgi:hypothetical protein